MAEHLKQRYEQALCNAYKGIKYDDKGVEICIMCEQPITCSCTKNGYDNWFLSLTLTEVAEICQKMGLVAY